MSPPPLELPAEPQHPRARGLRLLDPPPPPPAAPPPASPASLGAAWKTTELAVGRLSTTATVASPSSRSTSSTALCRNCCLRMKCDGSAARSSVPGGVPTSSPCAARRAAARASAASVRSWRWRSSPRSSARAHARSRRSDRCPTCPTGDGRSPICCTSAVHAPTPASPGHAAAAPRISSPSAGAEAAATCHEARSSISRCSCPAPHPEKPQNTQKSRGVAAPSSTSASASASESHRHGPSTARPQRGDPPGRGRQCTHVHSWSPGGAVKPRTSPPKSTGHPRAVRFSDGRFTMTALVPSASVEMTSITHLWKCCWRRPNPKRFALPASSRQPRSTFCPAL